ncbi:MAG: dockerin type I domain-containing protein, partial [Candidatus Omnitrophota bacterium]
MKKTMLFKALSLAVALLMPWQMISWASPEVTSALRQLPALDRGLPLPGDAGRTGNVVRHTGGGGRSRAGSPNRQYYRQLVAPEFLGKRDLLSVTSMVGFDYSHQPTDINGDHNTTPVDALIVINALNAAGIQPVVSTTTGHPGSEYLDPTDDQVVSPIDALSIVNALNNVDEVFTQMGANGAPVNVHRTGQDQVTITVSTPDGRTAAELTPPIALLPGRVADDVKFTWADGTHALVTINNGMNQAQSAGAFLINTDAGTIATLINPVLAAGATDNFWGENGPQAWVTSNQGKDQVVVANNGTANSGPFMTQPFITVWNAQTGAVVRQTPLSSSVSAAAFDAQRNAVMLTCPDPTAPGGATTQIKALMPDGSIRDSEVTDTSFTQHANNGNAVNVRFDQGHVVISAVDANGQQRASFTPAEVYVSSRFDTPYNLTNTIWSPDGNSAVVLIDNRMNLYQGTEVVYVDCVAGTVKELVSSKMVAGTEDNLWTANGPQVWLANGQIIAANTGYIPTDGTYAFWLVRPGISVWDAQTGALLKQTKLPMSVNDARLDAATNTVTVTYADAKAPNGVREQDWTVMADGSVKEKTGIEVTRTLDAGGTTATFAMPSIKRTATITVKDNTTVTLTIRTNKGAVLASHDLSTDVLTASKALQHAQFLTEPSGTWGLLVLPTYPTESSKASVTTFNLKSGAIMATLTPPASHEGDMSANRVQGNVAITGTGFAIETNFSRAFKATGLGNGTSYVTAYAPDGTVKSSLVVSKEFGSTVSVAGVGLGLRYSDMAYNGQGETFTTYYNVDASGNIWVSDNNDKTYSAAAMSALAAAPFTKSQMMMSFAGRATNPDGSGLVAIRYRDTATNALETWLVPFGKDGAINKAGITQSTESTPVIKNIDASGNETFTMPTLSRTATASAHDATTIAFTVFDGTGTALAAPTLLSTDVIAARDGIASMQVLPNADGKWAVVEYKDYPEGGVAEVVTVDLATGKKMADINPPSSNEGDFSADRVYGSVVIVNGSIETANYGKAFKATGLGNGTSYVMAYAPDGTVKSSVTVSKEFGSTTYVTGKGLGLVYSDMAYNGQGETFITYYGVDAAGNVSVTDNKDRELSTKAADALAAAPFTKASMMVSFAGRTENADGTSVVAMKWKNAATNTIETWLVPFDKNGAVVTGAITQTPESIPVITTFDAAGNATFAMPTLGHTATATAKDTTTIALTLRDANGTALAAPILLNTDVITAADSIKGMRFLPANGAWGAVVYQDYPKGQIAEVITVDLNAGTKIAYINPPASYQGDMSADRVYGNVWIINGDVVTVNFGQQPFTASGAGRGQTYMTVYTAQGAVVTSLLLTESFDSANYVQSKGINLPHSDVAWNGRPETFNVWRSIDASGAISVTDNKDREFATKAEVALNAAPYNKPMMPMSYAGRYQYSNGVSIVALNWLDTTTHTFETWLVPIGADGNAVASSISKATENDPVIKGYNTDGSALFVMPTLGSSAIAAPVATATRKVSITVFNANGDALATPIILDTGVISPADAIASMQILPNADGSWAVVEYSTYPKGAIADVITLDLHTGQQIAEINPPAAHQGDMSADRVYGNVWIINGNVVTVNYGWQPFTASGAGRGPSYITVYDVHGAVVNSLQPTYSFNSASYTPGKGVDIPRGVGAWNGQYETYNTWYGIDASGAISIVDTKDSQLAAKAETALNAAPYNKSTMPMSFAGRKENADGTSIVTLNWLNTTTHLLETWQVTFGTDDNVAPNGIRQISSTSSATFTFVTDLWSRGSWNNDERPITIGVANTTNGIAPVAGVDIVIGASADAGSAAASFHYDANAGTWFVGDADNEWTGGLSSSTAGTLTGVHGSLDLARTTVARTYSTMTLALQASLFAMSGRQGVFVSTTDQAGLATAFTRIGNWDVSSDAMPHLEQVTVPAVSIAGTAQTFTATCSDSNGTADI